ncbi:hypothetical protein AD949_01995 [Acetobacter orleanensis]|uniref:FecR N-terminal domain-containing protein n=1 Tax=Acetobacter orleanensis TaxID=104099 RepID=A0A4Y3TSR7_9PROT|nr:hypothetical protein AD949_01995 [Acetobacter orleanensis]GAN69733.1 hypothetical protein Abol_063_001 [Acetobacter orleanensis JCM 7639]GEB84137.1 hypothetical protein AOR01nite_26140 [Acetobacter orleanensis]
MISGIGLPRLADHTKTDRNETASFWVAKKNNAPLTEQEQALLETWLANDVRNKGALIRAEVVWQATSRSVALRTDNPILPDKSKSTVTTDFPVSRRHMISGLAASLALCMLPRTSHEMGRFYSTTDNTLDTQIPQIGQVSLDSYSQIRKYGTSIDHLAGRCLFSCSHPAELRLDHIHATVSGKLQSSLSVEKNRLLLLEGQAKIMRNFYDQPIVLSPGEELCVSSTGKLTCRKLLSDEITRETNWAQGIVELYGQPLSEVAATFNKYNQKKIFVHGKARSLVLLGSFALKDPDIFIDAVRSTLHIDGVVTSGRIDLY